MDNDNGTLRGLRDLLKKRKGMTPPAPKAFAGGGELFEDPMAMQSMVDPLMQSKEPAPMPLNNVAASLKQTPDTNYDFYKDLGADQRAALYKQLLAQEKSGGNMIAQGVAGLGDAISNSYGGKNNTFQKDVMANASKNTTDKIGAFDTQRSQKMQDMTANTEMASNDPKSPLSAGMRDILKAKGIPVPSGMSASLLVKVMGPLGDMAMKEATQMIQGAQLKETKEMNSFNRGLNRDKLAQETAQSKATENDKDTGRKMEAAKGLQSRPWYQKAFEAVGPDSTSTKLQKEVLGKSDEDKKADLRKKLGI